MHNYHRYHHYVHDYDDDFDDIRVHDRDVVYDNYVILVWFIITIY